MKMADNDAASSPNPNRLALKSNSHFNNYPIWKDKLRENCYRRVREDRNRLLWKMRLPAAQSVDNKDLIKSAFEEIVSDELKVMKASSFTESFGISNSDPHANDILWEYDGLHSAYQGECEEILLEMQRIFYEDFGEELTRLGAKQEPCIESWEDEEDEYLARAVYEHMQLKDKQVHEETWCPICKKGELRENHCTIYCTLCELQLKKDNEVNLDLLRVRLAEAHFDHLDRGCRLKPTFYVETRFDITALYICCQGCSTFEVVI